MYNIVRKIPFSFVSRYNLKIQLTISNLNFIFEFRDSCRVGRCYPHISSPEIGLISKCKKFTNKN